MAADSFDLDAILSRVSADTLRALEATSDTDAKLAAVVSGAVPGADEPPTDNPELAVLEAACFDTYIDRGDELLNADVVAAVRAAAQGKLIRADFDHSEFGWRLTEAGQLRLADLWGPDRVPPNKGGHVGCWDHGTYVAAPGDLWACPECPAADDEVLRQVEADADPTLRDVLADAEAQRTAVEPNIRAFEAKQRAKAIWRSRVRMVAREVGFAAAVVVLVLLLNTALSSLR